jgi:cell fate (sporulation/competence/biofilm development) regulator YmcA (YheA/YmcA/DUF963 family)
MIDKSLDELFTTIKDSDIYINYVHVLDQVMRSKDINKLINDIKRMQQKLVKEEHCHGKNVQVIEIKLEETKAILYAIPLYQDYLASSEELNNMLKLVRDKLQKCIDDLNI